MRCVTTAPKLVAHLLQGCSELVRTTCVLTTACNTLKCILYLCSRFADGESANTFKVTAAAAEEREVADDTVGIHVDSDKSAACATGYVF